MAKQILFGHLDDIRTINAKANYLSLEASMDGIPMNLHPGAIKYYEEQGLTVPDYLK